MTTHHDEIADDRHARMLRDLVVAGVISIDCSPEEAEQLCVDYPELRERAQRTDAGERVLLTISLRRLLSKQGDRHE